MMKCKKCGTEFNEGLFCPECGQQYEEEGMLKSEGMGMEESMDSHLNTDKDTNVNGAMNEIQNGNAFFKEKKPIFLSIPVILFVGLLTCGIGAFIMAIIRLKKYPEKKKSSIVVLVIVILFLLLIVVGALFDSQMETETSAISEENRNMPNESSNSEKSMKNESEEDSDNNIDESKAIEAVEVNSEEIYAVISEWQEKGLELVELGFPKNDVPLSSIYHIEAIYTDKDASQDDLIVEVEFQEEGYHYYFDFLYGYSSEEEEWYVKDIEKCRGNEWEMLQPADKEISSMLLEKEVNDEYSYSNIMIKQKEQEFFAFTAEIDCTITSTEGMRNANYIFVWNWENERWNFDQMMEPEPSLFEPSKEPDDSYVSNLISQMEEEILKKDDGREGRIELIEKDWKNTDEKYSYLYQYLQIEKARLVETRQNINIEVSFDRKTGYWNYEDIDCQYSGEPQKLYTIDGVWEGLEYETYEASWTYVIEILSVDSDNNVITVNSWCEFSPNGGEIEKTTICEEEKLTIRNGEYNILVGGYKVEHIASNGMDFTYKYIVEDGTLFINEESDAMFVSVQNPQMSTFLGIEMNLRE